MGPKLLRPFGTARVPGRRARLGDMYMRRGSARGACLSRSGALRKALGPCCRRAKQGNTLQIMWGRSFCGRLGLRAFRGGARGLGMCICGSVWLAARASAGRGRFQGFEFMTVRPTDTHCPCLCCLSRPHQHRAAVPSAPVGSIRVHACLQVGALRGSCVFIGYSALMPDALSD